MLLNKNKMELNNVLLYTVLFKAEIKYSILKLNLHNLKLLRKRSS